MLYICRSCSVPLKHETLSESFAGLSFSPNTHRQQDTDTTVCTLWRKHGWQRALPMVWWSVVTRLKEWMTRSLCLKKISITMMIIKPDCRSIVVIILKLLFISIIKTKKYLFSFLLPLFPWHFSLALTSSSLVSPASHFLRVFHFHITRLKHIVRLSNLYHWTELRSVHPKIPCIHSLHLLLT